MKIEIFKNAANTQYSARTLPEYEKFAAILVRTDDLFDRSSGRQSDEVLIKYPRSYRDFLESYCEKLHCNDR
jgi:hypothetical protein